MCEPLTLGIAAGITALSAGGDIFSGLMGDASIEDQNEAMEDALDAQYEREVQMANEQFILDQQSLEAKAIGDLEDAEADSRDKQAEARRMKASSEAAMAGLNISGRTALRTLGSFEIMGADLEDEADITKERTLQQYYADEDGNQLNRISRYEGAEAQREAGWNPKATKGALNHTMSATNAGLKGAASGLTIGGSIEQLTKSNTSTIKDGFKTSKVPPWKLVE